MITANPRLGISIAHDNVHEWFSAGRRGGTLTVLAAETGTCGA